MPVLPAPPAQSPGWPRWIEALAIVAFWALLGAVTLVRRALDPVPFSLHTVAITAVEYGPWLALTPAVFWLTRRFPLRQGRWGRRLAFHLAVAGLVTLALTAWHHVAIPALGPPPGASAVRAAPPTDGGAEGRPSRDRPPGDPTEASGTVSGPFALPGGPPLATPLHFGFYLFVLGVGFARAYALQVQARKAEAAQLAEARLGALRMQLNPHFFFNALNAVSALAGTDPVAVRQIVARLSSLLRRVLDADSAQGSRCATRSLSSATTWTCSACASRTG